MNFDMNKMLKEAQRMQAELAKAQEEAASEIVEASAGGGMVTVKANGAGEVVAITIDPRAIDPDDPELLADMILAAVNEALRSARGLMESKMSGLMPGDLGGLGGLLPGSYLASRHAGVSGTDGYAARVLSPAVENLVTQLTKLPGIGPSYRATTHVPPPRGATEDALELARAIEDVKSRVRFCRECGNLTEDELCEVCSDARRDRTLICVVEQPVDVVSLERTHEFRGLYHVLGGALSPLDGVEPSDLRIDGLLARVERDGVEEVVLATNPTMTGEATAAYIADRLRGGRR